MTARVDANGAFQEFFPTTWGGDARDGAWQTCAHFVEEALRVPNPNLFRIERYIRGVCEERGVDAKDFIKRAFSTDEQKALLRTQKKWVEAGFDETIVETDPEAVSYAVETGLIYTLAMFRDAPALDKGSPVVRFEGGRALFKVEGQWATAEEVKAKIPYSKEEKRFIGWNCIHPDGFVQHDDTIYTSLYPIATIRPDVYARVLRQGQEFWAGREDADEGKEKPYVLQVMTMGGRYFPNSWCTKNLEDMIPGHSSVRLIGPDGSVCSFGTHFRASDADRVWRDHFLTTVETHVPMPDFMESRPSCEVRVTSIAITKDRFESICRYSEEAAKGFPFNYATANCTRFGTTLMALCGVEVDTRTTAGEIISKIPPSLSDVPFIGRPLSRLAAAVAVVAVPIIDLTGALLRFVLPRCLRLAYVFVVREVSHVMKSMGAFITNLLAMTLLGAGRTFIPKGVHYQPNRGADGPLALPTSTRLMTWRDLLNPDALVFYHSSKLKHWQLAQRNATTVFTDAKFGLACLDPADGAVLS